MSNRKSQNHRTIAWFELKGIIKNHLTQSAATITGTFHQTRLPKDPSNLVLNTSSCGMLQCLTTVITEYFFLRSNLNLLSYKFKAIAPCLVTTSHGKSLCLFYKTKVLEGCNNLSLGISFLQAEQPQQSQPFFIGGVFQPFDFSWIYSGPFPTGPSYIEDYRDGCSSPAFSKIVQYLRKNDDFSQDQKYHLLSIDE